MHCLLSLIELKEFYMKRHIQYDIFVSPIVLNYAPNEIRKVKW